jgi:hypothetical protein
MSKLVNVLGSCVNGYYVRMDLSRKTVEFTSLAKYVWERRADAAIKKYEALVRAGQVSFTHGSTVDVDTAIKLLELVCPPTKVAQNLLRTFKKHGRLILEEAVEGYRQKQQQKRIRQEQQEIALTDTRRKISEASRSAAKLALEFPELVDNGLLKVLIEDIRPLAAFCYKLPEMK